MPTGSDIAMTALAIIGQTPQPGYIYGTSGQVWTEDDQIRITREKAGDPNYAYSIKYGDKWIGHRVYDCSGLTMRVYAENGIKLAHGSNSQHKVCKTTGPAMDAPVGALVFKLRGTDYHHVGVYVGSGIVVEAQGTVTGVIESFLTSWHEYGLVPGVDYGTPSPSPTPEPEPSPVPSDYLVIDVPNNGTVNLRDKPDGKRIGTLCEGQTVRPIRVSGEWTECEYPSTFWIMSKYLRKG